MVKGTLPKAVAREFFLNTGHFPLANAIYELLHEGVDGFFFDFDPYVIFGAAIIQSWYIGSATHKGRPRYFVGNLIGPVIYSLFELTMEGPGFLTSPNHLVYWFTAILFGLAQEAQYRSQSNVFRAGARLFEGLGRSFLVLALYAIAESTESGSGNPDPGRFLADTSHQFLSIVAVLLGLVIGSANIMADAYLRELNRTAAILKRFSQWFLGTSVLEAAMDDEAVLKARREHRAIAVMDIRGFTSWSSDRAPQEVAEMLNGYFIAAEQPLEGKGVVKVKHIGDEVMVVTETCEAALSIIESWRSQVLGYLAPLGLSMGIGAHYGEMVEGLIGGHDSKAYDVLGDTVNVAHRVCSAAKPGETLVTREFLGCIAVKPASSTKEELVKGKAEPLLLHSLKGA